MIEIVNFKSLEIKMSYFWIVLFSSVFLFSGAAQGDFLSCKDGSFENAEITTSRLGRGGGSKIPYLFRQKEKSEDSKFILLLPNFGHDLSEELWARMILEEVAMTVFLEGLGVPFSKLVPCELKKQEGGSVQVMLSPAFSSYQDKGAYVIDGKRYEARVLPPKEAHPLLNLKDPDESWIAFLRPLFNDLIKLGKTGIPFNGDSANIVFVARNSQWHSGSSLQFEGRFFGFDFSSKGGIMHQPESRTPLSDILFSTGLNQTVSLAIWTGIDPLEEISDQGVLDQIQSRIHQMIKYFENEYRQSKSTP